MSGFLLLACLTRQVPDVTRSVREHTLLLSVHARCGPQFRAAWRPPFITALAPEDRCHLNGLGVVPDEYGQFSFGYITALAATDTPQGWREHKKDGGVVVAVPNGKILARGLCMPHSPRWINNRLWLLESGKGGFGFLQPSSGRYECLAELPGFTRGLDFYDHWAFIGLSQARESPYSAAFPSSNGP